MKNLSSLKYSKVSFSYTETQPVLDQIDLELCTNEIVGILGPNGAGKSTLLKLANGLLRPQSGKVLLNNGDISKQVTSQLARQIMVTFQFTRQQFFASTVEKELLVTLSMYVEDKSERNIRLESLLEQFDLGKLRNHHPYILSGGEQRRLSMAIAMAVPANFFLFDEPTANVDRKSLLFLLTTLREMRNQGKGIIIVSHDIEFQLALCDRLIILINGSIQFNGTVLDVINLHKTKEWDFMEIPEIYSFIQRLERKHFHTDLLKMYLAQHDLKAKITMISNILEKK